MLLQRLLSPFDSSSITARVVESQQQQGERAAASVVDRLASRGARIRPRFATAARGSHRGLERSGAPIPTSM
jgi:hypothetical protein